MVVCQRQTRRIAPVVGTSIVGLALMVASVLIASSRQEERHISVNDARPLAAAVKQLEADLGQVITYEDPPYLYPGDYVDLTSAVSNVPSPKMRVLAPRGGPFTFTYTRLTASARTAEGRAEARAVASRLVEAYNGRVSGVGFDLLTVGNAFHVVPVAARDRAGVTHAHQSMLDALISVSTQPTDGLTALEAVLGTLRNQSRANLRAGIVPLNLLGSATVTLDATARPAREVLLHVLDASGKRLSWQIFCSPGDHFNLCALNVHPVD